MGHTDGEAKARVWVHGDDPMTLRTRVQEMQKKLEELPMGLFTAGELPMLMRLYASRNPASTPEATTADLDHLERKLNSMRVKEYSI